MKELSLKNKLLLFVTAILLLSSLLTTLFLAMSQLHVGRLILK